MGPPGWPGLPNGFAEMMKLGVTPVRMNQGFGFSSVVCAALARGKIRSNSRTTTGVHVVERSFVRAMQPGASTYVLHVVVVAATGSDRRERAQDCKRWA